MTTYFIISTEYDSYPHDLKYDGGVYKVESAELITDTPPQFENGDTLVFDLGNIETYEGISEYLENIQALINVVIFVSGIPTDKKFEIPNGYIKDDGYPDNNLSNESITSLVFRKSTTLNDNVEYLDELYLGNCGELSGDFIMPGCVKKCKIHDCAFTSFKYDGIYSGDNVSMSDFSIMLCNLYDCKSIDVNKALYITLNEDSTTIDTDSFKNLEYLKVTNSLANFDTIGGENKSKLKFVNFSNSITSIILQIYLDNLSNLETINISNCHKIRFLVFDNDSLVDSDRRYNLYLRNIYENALKYLYLDGTDLHNDTTMEWDKTLNGSVNINNSNLVELTLPHNLKRAEIKYNNYLQNITFDNISYGSDKPIFDICYNMNLRSINGKSSIEGILKNL